MTLPAMVLHSSAMTITFTQNPSYPRQDTRPAPVAVNFRTADGTPHKEWKGMQAIAELSWPAGCPMTDDDYADLLDFHAQTRGTGFEFTDEDGNTWDAAFASDRPIRFDQVPHGFAGSITIMTFA